MIRRVIATAAVLAAMALVVLDAGMANVALPTIAGALQVAPGTSILIVSAYQLALLMGLLPAAHVAERIGYRRVFVTGVAVFTGASVLASIAPTFPMLVAARFIQGVGGAAILALGIALLRFALGTERLGTAIGWNALNVALCSAAGPTVGALILTVAEWPWLFLVNLPVGLLALAASRALPKVPPSPSSIDLVSILLHAGGAALLFLAVQLIADRPAIAVGLAALALAGFALLVKRELPKPSPLVPLDLLRRRPFRLAVGASICCFVAQSGAHLALPFYLQLELSRSALATGIVVACWPIAVALTSRRASSLAERHQAGLLCAAGAAVLSAGLVSASLLPSHASLVLLGICVTMCGIGFGLFQVPNNRNLFLAAPPDRSAAAGGMQGTARLTGQTGGSLLAMLLFAWSPITATPRLTLTIAALFALAAALVSLRHMSSADARPRPCVI
jgi:DHA2 family multidrug resistance protein-like MFS transporter